MANLVSLLNDRIRRVARREIRGQTQKTRRLTAQHRRDIAALKRQVAALARTVAFLEKQEQRRVASPPAAPQEVKGVRFSARSVKAQRARLGLSAKDFGRLVGVAALTIYSWESGKSRPRKKQLPGLAAVRRLGKREASKRLEMIGEK
jgi:DNA-binding transcriptional regulator YiaG